VPVDEPLAANPPDGAVLDYYLKEKSSSPIQLEIFDSEGKLIRRFASDDKLYRTDPNSVPFTMNWVPDLQPLSQEAGMHRFVWDLRAALPEGVRRSYRMTAGPWILPGDYTVKLTANGKSSTRPLTVKMDPRSRATPEALQHQFALASQLSRSLGEVSAALQLASDLRKQIEERKRDAAGKTEILAALEDINRKIERAAGPDTEADFGLLGPALPDKEHAPLRRLATALTGLLAVAESADVAPASDLTAAAERWDAARKDTLAQWKNVLEQVRVELIAKLQNADRKPLVLK